MEKMCSLGKSEDLTVATVKSTTFWDMTPCSLVEIYLLSEEHSSEDNTLPSRSPLDQCASHLQTTARVCLTKTQQGSQPFLIIHLYFVINDNHMFRNQEI
jgi:hypothetical protein